MNLVNLELLGEAADLLMGPNGALRLAAVYAVLEKVSDAGYESGFQDGWGGDETDEETADDETDIETDQTHYDVWHGRYHRPGAGE